MEAGSSPTRTIARPGLFFRPLMRTFNFFRTFSASSFPSMILAGMPFFMKNIYLNVLIEKFYIGRGILLEYGNPFLDPGAFQQHRCHGRGYICVLPYGGCPI